MSRPNDGKAARRGRVLGRGTPIALRWPSLVCLAVYVGGLLLALEYGRRTFPIAEDRSIPQDTKNQLGPFKTAPLTGPQATARLSLGPPHRLARRRVGGENTHPIWHRSNGTAGNTTSIKLESTSEPTAAAGFPAENSSAVPIQIGYRKLYPPGYLNHSKQLPTLGRRVKDPDHYGELLGPVQKYATLSGRDDASDTTNVFLSYFGEKTAVKDLREFNIFLLPDWELCRIRCYGSALLLLDDVCWKQELKYAFSTAINSQLGAVTFGEMEYPGGKRCPLPEAINPDATEVDVDLVETTTMNGVLTTLTKHTRIPLMPETVVVTGADGRPVATKTRLPTAALTTMTLTNRKGEAVATVTAEMGLVPTVLTLVDASGRPTATITTSIPVRTGQPGHGSGIPGNKDTPKYLQLVSRGSYIGATFLPVLLSTVLSVAAQTISAQLKTVLPFHALTRPGGATAADSLCMDVRGFAGLVGSFRLLFRFKEPLSLLSDLIILCSIVVASLSSEAIGIKLYGACKANNFEGCYMGIAVFNAPSRIVEGFLGAMLVGVALMCLLRSRWRTGVNSVPRSIAGLASLLQDGRTRELFRDIPSRTDGDYIRNHEILERLDGYFFHLGRPQSDNPIDSAQLETLLVGPLVWQASTRSVSGSSGPRRKSRKQRVDLPFQVESAIQGLFLFILCSSLILIVYYESTMLDTPFERFMDNQGFGVRALFTGLGVAISFFWERQFSRISMLEPYRRLSQRDQPAGSSVLLRPSCSPFTGLVRSAAQGDLVVASVALITVLSKFTPVLLANVPFSPFQTWTTHRVCAWLTVGILAVMILVLVLEWAFVRYPYLPVDPITLAGGLYYICDSEMVHDFNRVFAIGENLGKWSGGGKRYTFGRMVGVSGHKRIGVDHTGEDNGH